MSDEASLRDSIQQLRVRIRAANAQMCVALAELKGGDWPRLDGLAESLARGRGRIEPDDCKLLAAAAIFVSRFLTAGTIAHHVGETLGPAAAQGCPVSQELLDEFRAEAAGT